MLPYVAKSITLASHTVEVLDNGVDSEDVVFLFHWNSGSAMSCSRMFHTDLGASCRLIAPSLVGHGGSSRAGDPTSEYSLQGIGRFIQSFISSYGFHKYWIVAQSVSAHAVLEAHEDFTGCAGFVSVSAPPVSLKTLGSAFAQSSLSTLLFRERLSSEEMRDLSRAFAQSDEDVQTVYSDLARADPKFRSGLGESVTAGGLRDEICCYKEIAFPGLLIRSPSDVFINAEYYDELLETHGLPATIATVQAGGHALLMNRPTECSSVIRRFMDSHR